MPLLAWIDEYSIGNEEIDLQHKELFDVFNKLYDTLSGECSAVDVYLVLEALIDYADFHFTAEQQLMIDTGYKDVAGHILEHEYFTNEVLKLSNKVDKAAAELTQETIVFLCRWLLRHVTEEDNKITAGTKGR
jgi:hemerythrin